MRLLRVIAFPMVLISACVAAADEPADTLKKLSGRWKVKSAEIAGMEMPQKERDRVRVFFDGEKISFLGLPDGDRHTTFKIDTGKTPGHIDIQPPRGETKVAAGIFKFEGEVLTLCFSEAGETRPAGFKAGKGVILIVLTKTTEK